MVKPNQNEKKSAKKCELQHSLVHIKKYLPEALIIKLKDDEAFRIGLDSILNQTIFTDIPTQASERSFS